MISKISKLVTGVIEQWIFSEGMIFGRVFGDVKRRFPDGSYIHTSTVLESSTKELQEGSIVETLNSIYRLGKPMMEPKLNNELDQLNESYAAIRRIHGNPETELNNHVQQIKHAIKLNDDHLYRMLINRFKFADDGVRYTFGE